MKESGMSANSVVEIIQLLEQNSIEVYVDGGWGVDALLGEQTRTHGDLDIALPHKFVPKLRELFEARGYKDVLRDDTRECNFVLGDDKGHLIDIHSYTFDENGKNIFGVAYEPYHLTGTGVINGYPIKCIPPDVMVEFHTGYEVDENDYLDVKALCERFNICLPSIYDKFEKIKGANMETERLLIRRFTPDDWQDLYEYLSQAEVVEFEPYDVFTEEASKQEAVRRSENSNFWAVCLKDCMKLIGNLYLAKQEFDTWELGYVFNQNYHNKGYATEAAKALLDDAFKNQNARRVVAMCSPLNEPSWKLLERLGLRREGHLIKNIYFKKDKEGNPIWYDTYEYGILAEEWLSR